MKQKIFIRLFTAPESLDLEQEKGAGGQGALRREVERCMKK